MTTQIDDTCFHRKINFAIAGISGSGLFEPESIGIRPLSMCTACWRGYVAHYSIIEGVLVLTSLQPPQGERPQLFGLTSLQIGLPQGEPPELFGGFCYVFHCGWLKHQ
jgi:hypothetical protein